MYGLSSANAHGGRQDSSGSPGVIRLTVNGKRYEFKVGVDVMPFTALRELLRDRLGLTSLKEMCEGEGVCGSCTVLVDGRPTLSCLTLAVDCDGKEIETVEGLAESGHPLLEAFSRNYAYQCGYCTPGFIMSAKALLDRNPDPSYEDIVRGLSGNICRCGTYAAILSATREAADALKARRGGGGL